MYKFGTMGSGKSMELLKVAYNYREQEKPVMIFTSALDSRYGNGIVASRSGIEEQAIPVDNSVNIYSIVNGTTPKPKCVLVDEAQFLSSVNVEQLAAIVDDLNIPVIAYGLKNDFRGQLFDGSKRLLELADKIEEIKTICWYCERKATHVLRFKNGMPTFIGDQIQIGGNDVYKPVCRKHFHNPIGVTVITFN